MNITTVLPVSRTKHLNRVLDSLRVQTYKIEKLLIVLEGVSESDVDAKGLNVTFIKSNNASPSVSRFDRRKNISNIHNQLRELVDGWVFSVEDDGILPPDALEKLVKTASDKPDVGIVTGVELGRWGFPYVGAWRADNIFEPTEIKSVDQSIGVESIDACGLYCALIEPSVYKYHSFTCSNGLGPDVNLGLYSRRCGYNNYIDWSVLVTHLGNIPMINAEPLEIEIKADEKARSVKLSRINDSFWQTGD